MRGSHGAKLKELEGAPEFSRPLLPKDNRKSDVNGHKRCDNNDQGKQARCSVKSPLEHRMRALEPDTRAKILRVTTSETAAAMQSLERQFHLLAIIATADS